MTPYLVTCEPDEFALVERVWGYILASGHADHGGFYRDGRDPEGYLRCYCGKAVEVPGELVAP